MAYLPCASGSLLLIVHTTLLGQNFVDFTMAVLLANKYGIMVLVYYVIIM